MDLKLQVIQCYSEYRHMVSTQYQNQLFFPVNFFPVTPDGKVAGVGLVCKVPFFTICDQWF